VAEHKIVAILFARLLLLQHIKAGVANAIACG
jgi:hypothetical protein